MQQKGNIDQRNPQKAKSNLETPELEDHEGKSNISEMCFECEKSLTNFQLKRSTILHRSNRNPIFTCCTERQAHGNRAEKKFNARVDSEINRFYRNMSFTNHPLHVPLRARSTCTCRESGSHNDNRETNTSNLAQERTRAVQKVLRTKYSTPCAHVDVIIKIT